MARKNRKNLGTTLLAAGGAAIGGYYIGNSVDNSSTSPSTSAFASYSVIIPAIIGALGWFLLKGRNKQAANGLLLGGLAGAGYGYMQYSKMTAGAYTPGGGVAAYLGAPRQTPAVRRALLNPNGSAMGATILPPALRTKSPAYPGNAWARR